MMEMKTQECFLLKVVQIQGRNLGSISAGAKFSVLRAVEVSAAL